ncbi:MAG: sulfurtransferase [Gammaproteobacteria bacterium]|nr:sulfurtransferase [Gammaproteobacteria bacterium]
MAGPLFCVLLFFSVIAQAGVENISNEKLKSLLDGGAILVDIRTRGEWQETGIIEGSHTLTLFDELGRPVADFVPQLQKIADKATPVIVICRTGNRTRAASDALTRQIGYQTVYNVTNGITDWIAKGYPVIPYKP